MTRSSRDKIELAEDGKNNRNDYAKTHFFPEKASCLSCRLLNSKATRRTDYNKSSTIQDSHLEIVEGQIENENGEISGKTSVRDLLRKQWLEKQQRLGDGDALGLGDCIQSERDTIQTVRKERVFEEEITSQEIDIINQRVELQQRQFQEFQRRETARKIRKVQGMFAHLSEEEIQLALEESNGREDSVILHFTKHDYLAKIRKMIALKYNPTSSKASRSTEEQAAYDRLVEKRKREAKKTTSKDAKRKSYTYVRLTLDDALNQLESASGLEDVFKDWSEARIKAYKLIDTNPNSYYYRFNAPGEKQVNGLWSAKERDLFFKRLAEVGADGAWGTFSMAIPGRVGYQCSNFYRSLIKSGEVKDDNYFIDEKGKIHYLFGKKSDGSGGIVRTHSKHGSKAHAVDDEDGTFEDSSGHPSEAGPSRAISSRSAAAPSKKRRKEYPRSSRKKRGVYNEEDDDEDEFVFLDDDSISAEKGRSYRSKSSSTAEVYVPCVLPGFIDPITLDEVVKPAISPYGHVMSYDTWVRCLMSSGADQKNICPITKKPLSKRELVLLTEDNIEEYRYGELCPMSISCETSPYVIAQPHIP